MGDVLSQFVGSLAGATPVALGGLVFVLSVVAVYLAGLVAPRRASVPTAPAKDDDMEKALQSLSDALTPSDLAEAWSTDPAEAWFTGSDEVRPVELIQRAVVAVAEAKRSEQPRPEAPVPHDGNKVVELSRIIRSLNEQLRLKELAIQEATQLAAQRADLQRRLQEQLQNVQGQLEEMKRASEELDATRVREHGELQKQLRDITASGASEKQGRETAEAERRKLELDIERLRTEALEALILHGFQVDEPDEGFDAGEVAEGNPDFLFGFRQKLVSSDPPYKLRAEIGRLHDDTIGFRIKLYLRGGAGLADYPDVIRDWFERDSKVRTIGRTIRPAEFHMETALAFNFFRNAINPVMMSASPQQIGKLEMEKRSSP